MKIKFVSEYNDFTMFLTEFKVGADAIVFDKDAGYCLCKVVCITEGKTNDIGDYSACFVIPDGEFFVGVEFVRPASSLNEFENAVKEFFESKEGYYC